MTMEQRGTSTPVTVLLVESNVIVGLDVADDLEQRGYNVEGPFHCAAALEWIETQTPDVAVLDVDLRTGPCVALARELLARGVPIAVFSAHDQRDALTEFRALPWLSMPAPLDALDATLQGLAAREEAA